MNKYQLLKLFLNLQKNSEKGLTLIELIVALVMSGIVLTMAASGFINVLRANQDVESKTVRNTGLQRALAFLQEDLKQASTATTVTNSDDTNCTSASPNECLKLDMPDGRTVYYAYEDISSGTNIFLKPGILKRQAYIVKTPIDDSNFDPNALVIVANSDAWKQENTTIADGLINTSPSSVTDCTSGGITWNGDNKIYGADSGGFRFCLDSTSEDNRLVRVFLYGTTVNKNANSEMEVNIIGFSRAGARLFVSADPDNTSSLAKVKATWTPVPIPGVTDTNAKSCVTTSSTVCSPSISYTKGTEIPADLSATNSNVCFLLTVEYNGETTNELQCAK